MKRVKPQYSGLLKRTNHCSLLMFSSPVEHLCLKLMHEVISVVHWLGKPAVIRNEEIDMIKKFLSLYTGVILKKILVSPNSTISDLDSNLILEKGKVSKMNGFVIIQLPSLGYVLKARVSQEFIKTKDTLLFDNDLPLFSGKFAS